ncbi:MAG: translocation/assembly module TamB [Bacteroidales bacterium]|nr:translocation/assembly module TamB [Bacteroidales bacterium]MCF8391748.1 translocation/assembly module TamB [Bacteroidales bacterium]
MVFECTILIFFSFFYIFIFTAIKKFTKILIIIFLVTFTLPATAVLFLQNKKIQSHISQYLTTELGNKLETNISIDNVAITFFNRFLITNLYIEDQAGEPLFFSKKVKLRIQRFSKTKNLITVKSLYFNEADVHIYTDSAGVNNLSFIIDAINKPNKKSKDQRLNLVMESIGFQDSKINIRTSDEIHPRPGIVNLQNITFSEFNSRIGNLHFTGDTVNFEIRNMDFIENSGFVANNLRAEISFNKKKFNFSNLFLETPVSEVSASNLSMSYNDFSEFSNFIENIDLNINLRSSYIGLQDLAYFSPVFENIDERILISGLISGTVSDLSGEKILLAAKNYSGFKGSFNIIGLPKIEETFMYYDISHFQTHLSDLKNINFKNQYSIHIPEGFEGLGAIVYSGKFTGYLDDFVAYGILETDIGKISTDVLITPTSKGGISFQGKVNTRSLAIGEVIGENDLLGNLSMSAMVDGSYENGGISANLNGIIDSLEMYNYIYQDIDLSGYLSNRIFDGFFNISDPNIKMDFSGKIDFSDQIPVFDFTADVMRIRPYYLNINKSDPSYFASFLLTSNFSGIDPDQINGEIKLINSFFQNSEEYLQMYDLNILAMNSPDSSALTIRSDILDADIEGNYTLSTLGNSFAKLASHYLPSISKDDQPEVQTTDYNSFEYSIHLKSIDRVLDFFTKDYEIGNNSRITGHYDSKSYTTLFDANIPTAGIKEKKWENIHVIAKSDSLETNLSIFAENFLLTNDLVLENLEVKSKAAKDKLTLKLNWENDELVSYAGSIDMLAILSTNEKTDNIMLDLELSPSYIVFSDTLWSLPRSNIHIDSTSVKIDSFQFNYMDQAFLLTGTLSENKEDKLDLFVENFQLSFINIFTKSEKLIFDGITTGVASLSSVYAQPIVMSDLNINSFEINNESFGDAVLQATWDNTANSVKIIANSIKGNSKILDFNGLYNPLEQSIDFSLDFDKIRLLTFEPFAEDLVSDIKGLGSGSLRLTGSFDQPELDGDIQLFKSSFFVNYLKTRYNLTDRIQISNNNLLFKDVKLSDEYANKGNLNGIITSKFLKDFNLNLNFETTNFSFLNTTEFDNELFYGKVFAGGIVNFTGPPTNLFMEINARSERNSVFYIPLFGSEEINQSDFIQFVSLSDKETIQDDSNGKYDVKMQGLTMNFKLEVTPDAEVQLIFDPKIGDILRGRGNGNLNLSISTLGKFEIYGDMIIEEGDYLFTLQNIINKRFKVSQGGSIIWNGDPEDATIDLKAIYSLSTSVYELSPEPQEELKRRIPVECHIIMTDKLMNPTIKTDIVLPTADQETRNIVSNSINTEEELTKQFLSLLVINSFYSETSDKVTGSYNAANVAGTAASELFSNQLSNWLSQISNDVDLGLNYRRGDQISSNELEFALSTQILNDRVTINGNLDVASDQTRQTSATTNTNNIVGDFDIDFKLTPNGKVHLKAFNRANDNLTFQTSQYTQGVGVFYREDFNTLKDLMRRYKEALNRLFTKKE